MFKSSTYIVSSSMSFSSLLLSIVVDMTFCEWSVAPSSISSRSPSLSPCKATNPTFHLGHLLPLVYISKATNPTFHLGHLLPLVYISKATNPTFHLGHLLPLVYISKATNPTFHLGHLLPLVYIHKSLSKTRQYFTWLCLKKPLV